MIQEIPEWNHYGCALELVHESIHEGAETPELTQILTLMHSTGGQLLTHISES